MRVYVCTQLEQQKPVLFYPQATHVIESVRKRANSTFMISKLQQLGFLLLPLQLWGNPKDAKENL